MFHEGFWGRQWAGSSEWLPIPPPPTLMSALEIASQGSLSENKQKPLFISNITKAVLQSNQLVKSVLRIRARILFMQTAALFIPMLTACAALIIALHFVTFINLILDTNKCMECPECSTTTGD